MANLVASPFMGDGRLTAVGASPDATFVIQNFRRLKSALKFCVINYGLKSVAWFAFNCIINYGLMPIAWGGKIFDF